MSPTQLEETLSTILSAKLQRAVMIWGPPGIGKSSIVAQLATQHGLELLDLRLSQLAPTDLRGLPVADGAVSKWLPPEFLPVAGNGILFLDEVNMAPPAVQGIAQQLILDRRVGSYVVPEGWFIWAAGNRKEDRAAVYDMPAPLANRFLHFQVETSFECFRAWAGRAGLHEQILAFLAFRPTLLHKPDPKSAAWPSSRSWQMASELLELQLAIDAAVGEAAAGEFRAFVQVYDSIPNLDGILAGHGGEVDFPREPSQRYAVTVGLSSRAGSSESIKHGFGWLLAKAGAEWCQLFIHAVEERAVKNGQIGLLATLVKQDARISRFLKAFSKGASKE
jgi:MoxR-like ATPase